MMIRAIAELLSSSPKELVTFIMAMLPVLELRAAIPFALSVGLGIEKTLTMAIIGNIVPVLPLLFLLEPVSTYLRRFWLFKRFFNWLFDRTRRRSGLIEKYEALGLILFVAIPLPVTGAWTGCVAASLLKIRLRYAFLAITTGVCIAAIIVTIAYCTGKNILVHALSYH